MGLHAGFGLPFMLNEVSACVLTDQDVVVLSFEYEHFGDRKLPGIELLEAMISQPGNVQYVGRDEVGWCLDNGLHWFSRVTRQAVDRAIGLPADNAATPPYSRSSFNEFGDVVGHREMPPRRPLIASTWPPVSLAGIDESIDLLNRFYDACQRRNVTVFYAFPPIERAYAETNGTSIRLVANRLRGRLNIPLLNESQALLLDERLFFDSIYHLTAEGAAHRTELLAVDLRKRLPTLAHKSTLPSDGRPDTPGITAAFASGRTPAAHAD